MLADISNYKQTKLMWGDISKTETDVGRYKQL